MPWRRACGGSGSTAAAREYFHDEVGYQQPAGHPAGGRPAGQAAASGRDGARPASATRRATRGVHGPCRHVPARDRPGERAHLQSVHPQGATPGRAAGTSQGEGHRQLDLLSAVAPSAAVLRASRLRQGSLPASEAAIRAGDLAAGLPGAHRGAAAGGHRRRARSSTHEHRPGPDRPGRAAGGAVRHRGPRLRRAPAGGRAAPTRASACSASTCSRRWSTVSTPAIRT